MSSNTALFSVATPLAAAFAPGSGIFAIFLVALTVAVMYGLYGRRGSGISQRPYGNVYSNSPGASGPSTLGNDRVAATRLTRGTRS